MTDLFAQLVSAERHAAAALRAGEDQAEPRPDTVVGSPSNQEDPK